MAAGYRTATGTPEFKRQIDLLKMKAETEGKTEDQIKVLVDQEVAKQKAAVLEVSKGHLKASLGRLDTKSQVLKRLVPTDADPSASEEQDLAGEDQSVDDDPALVADDLEVALIAEDLLSEPEPEAETDNINSDVGAADAQDVTP